MNTPIYDYIIKYINKKPIRLHMPGHKGRALNGELTKLYPFDITEIKGADSLFEANGIIAESEKNASELFKTKATYYSAGGSTLCIQAMMYLMKLERRNVIAVRNVHRSFLSACVLLNIEPDWIYPEYSGSILSGRINISQLENKLIKMPNSCVYITSPDYLGITADIKCISKLCRKYGAVLLVDNAHGAHTAFMPDVLHPIAAGADMCCDSAHKTLPALTGAAYLHLGNKAYTEKAKKAMAMFGSTSPSYLIMSSLDLCNRYISLNIKADIERTLKRIEKLKNEITPSFSICDGEPYHLTLLGNGIKLAEELRNRKIECEYADNDCLVLLLSPMVLNNEIDALQDALFEIRDKYIQYEERKISFPKPERAMSVRSAALSDYETLPVDKALGRICACIDVPCPPAVPIAVSGEIISDECIKICKRYGILNINVVK